MKNYSYLILKELLTALLLFTSIAVQAGANGYSHVFVFGDSLSDTGNLGAVIGGIPAPYYNNRISNGPVAIDTLAERLGKTAEPSLHLLQLNNGDNYSVAGAKASGVEFSDLNTQLLAFQVNQGFVAPADALYVIFLGGNDLRAALYEEDRQASLAIIQAAEDAIRQAIETLSAMGARAFLVVNAPDIGLLPETKMAAQATGDPELIRRASHLSRTFNKKLHKMIRKIDHSREIAITEFDLPKSFKKIINMAYMLGFSNRTEACFSSSTGTFDADCEYGLNADQYIFFDEIHPSARVHKIVGEALYRTLRRSYLSSRLLKIGKAGAELVEQYHRGDRTLTF